MKNHQYYVYILSNVKNGTLYIGITNDLVRRMYEHRHSLLPGFTNKYGLDRLVYYEHTADVKAAIQREKQLKRWRREWKINLIEKQNAEWEDLFSKICGNK